MERLREATEDIIRGVSDAIDSLNEDEVEAMIRTLLEAREQGKKVFVIGMGRSGLVARAFALRLLHLGFNVYVLGETINPAAEAGDILLAISGSGITNVVVSEAELAKRIGVKVIAITSHRGSPLGRRADSAVIIKGRTKVARRKDYLSRQILGEHEPLAPLGTIFEVSCMVFLDSIIVELMSRLGLTEEYIRKRHATIE